MSDYSSFSSSPFSDQPENPTSFSSSNNPWTSDDENIMFNMDNVPPNPNQLPVYDPPPHHQVPVQGQIPLPVADPPPHHQVPVQGQIPLPVAPILVEQPQPVALNPPHLIDAAAEAEIDVQNGAAVAILAAEQPDPNHQANPLVLVPPLQIPIVEAAPLALDPQPPLPIDEVGAAQQPHQHPIHYPEVSQGDLGVEQDDEGDRHAKRLKTTQSALEMYKSSFGLKDERSMVDVAWQKLRSSVVSYNGKSIGTRMAAKSKQIFVRDFVPSALAFLMNGEKEELDIVKNFLFTALQFQSQPKRFGNMALGGGVVPTSLNIVAPKSPALKAVLVAEFGGSEDGGVAPVDCGFWWIVLLWFYTNCTKDRSIVDMPEIQRGVALILKLCLTDGFDTFPTLHCADGCSMMDRRMGINGHPIEIQSLFFFALRCAEEMLKPEDCGKELIEEINHRVRTLRLHMKTYFWLDFPELNNIQRYLSEEYIVNSAIKKFNVNPESVPDWVLEFMPLHGGYFIGNLTPGCMDFRWFLVGNCIAILSSLASPKQTTAIMELFDERWEELIGEMPLKIAYPALEGEQWRTVTGSDFMNTPWSFHNGGSWPVLLWLFTAACIKANRTEMAMRAIEKVEQRLATDGWPEYYQGKTGKFIGKQAKKYQTWSIAGYLVSKMMVEDPLKVQMISLEEDQSVDKPRLTRSTSWDL